MHGISPLAVDLSLNGVAFPFFKGYAGPSPVTASSPPTVLILYE